MPSRPTTVRIDDKIYRKLEAQAKKLGMRPGEFIREAAYERLAGADTTCLSQQVSDLSVQVDQLRADLAKVARAVLVVSGSDKLLSEESADAWLERTFGEKIAELVAKERGD